MKNLFKFATKELSQDAFLRWFIEIDFEGSGRKLLAKFARVNFADISDVKTWAQSEHIDICVDFKVKNEPHILIIEDKVNTNDHSNQLERYMRTVRKWNNWRKEYRNRKSHFIFCKPRIVSDEQKEKIQSAKIEGCDFRWEVFDLLQIDDFFSKYGNCSNQIISQYSEYVSSLKKDSINESLPKENNILAWKSFFERTVKPTFDQYELRIYVNETFYGYSYIVFRPKTINGKETVDEKTPYLEFRSRDCVDRNIVGRILLYNVKITDGEKECFKKRIKDKGKLFKAENNSQQIGSTKKRNEKPISCINGKDYIDKLHDIVEEYLSFFE